MRGYSLGAVDYILTPVVPDVLRTKVSVFVDLYRMTQQVKRQAEERSYAGARTCGPSGGRAGQPRQERVFGEHQPRAAHADERHYRHDRFGVGRRAFAAAARISDHRPIECPRAVGIAERNSRFLAARSGQVRAAKHALPPARFDRRFGAHVRVSGPRQGPGDGIAHRRRGARPADGRSAADSAGVDEFFDQRASNLPNRERFQSTSHWNRVRRKKWR